MAQAPKRGGESPPRITDIHVNFKPQAEQRYKTLGDWQIKTLLNTIEGTHRTVLYITITQMPDQRYQWPLAVHELVEALLCHVDEISTEEVDAWDIHGEGRHLDEPGDDPKAPYHVQHMAAGDLEIQMAQLLGFTAGEYANYIDKESLRDDEGENR